MNTTTPKPYTFDRVIRIIIGLSVVIALFFITKKLSSVLLPFLAGWLLAYLLNPVVNFFQFKLRFKYRVPAITATLILFFGSIFGIIVLLIPLVSKELTQMYDLVYNFSTQVQFTSFLPVAWQQNVQNYLEAIDWEILLNNPNIQNLIQKLSPWMWEFLSSSIHFILGLMVIIVVFLYLVFILLDFEKITEGWLKIVPIKYREIVNEIYADIQSGMNRYFRGQAMIALISGALMCIGFYIIHLPLAIVFGIFVGILTMVPYLKTVSVVPAFFLVWLQAHQTGQSFWMTALAVVLVYAIVQMIEDMILVPKIMGKVTGLKPAVILLSLSIWGSLMGLAGMIIALPLTTLITSYYKRWVLREDPVNKEITEQKDTV